MVTLREAAASFREWSNEKRVPVSDYKSGDPQAASRFGQYIAYRIAADWLEIWARQNEAEANG
jgi:hypothetical protein